MEKNDLQNESNVTIEEQVNVFSQPTHTINPVVYFFMNIGESIWKFVRWFLSLLLSMILALLNFFKTVGLGIYGFGLGVVNFFKRKGHQFKYNDKDGRISYGIFGYSSLKNKQYTFGILYIVFQVVYIVLFAVFGLKWILKLTTLGTVLPYEDPDADFSELIMGDNSIMILIYGLLWILSIAVFVYIWNRSVNVGYYHYRAKNLLKFDKLYEKNLDFDKKIDDGVRQAFAENISLSQYKKSHAADVLEYLSQIENEFDRDYSKYLINNSYHHTYEYLHRVKNQEKKIAQTEKWRDLILAKRKAKLEKLVNKNNEKLEKCNHAEKEKCLEKNEVFVEMYNHRTDSLVSGLVKKHEAQEHQLYEINKRYASYVEMQRTSNNAKYGKENIYYKHVAELENAITFYTNFHKFVNIYNEGLLKFENKNQENAQMAVDLLELMNRKQANTKAKFDEIRLNKQQLNEELVKLQVEYKKEVAEIKKSNGANSQKLLEAKANLVDKTTIIMRRLNDLPTDKNIKALEKEELSESKRAYLRDKKYLKTDYTDKELGFEEVVNEMVVTYKFDYSLAVEFAKSMFIKEKTGETRMLTANEVAEKLQTVKQDKADFITNNQTKYVVKFKSFKDSIKSLFNEKFNITILLLPIAGIVLFSIVPLIFSIFIAFTNYSNGHIPPTELFTWVGFDNFVTLISPNPDSQFAKLPMMLGKTIGWTLLWAVIATFSNYILGIIVALMINKDGIKFKKLWRTVFVMTIAIPQFISLLSIGTLLKDSGAIGNWYSQTFGSRLGFGTDGSANAVFIAKFVIIMVNIWVGIPYTILSTTGILLNIPKDLYESARVDGAGTVTQFTKITMPYILFVTGPYLITQFIGNINNFNVIFFLTGGGPAYAGVGLLGLGQTDLLITFIYKIVTSTSNPQYGLASAIGIIVFIICSFISIVMYNKSGSIKEEDQFQ